VGSNKCYYFLVRIIKRRINMTSQKMYRYMGQNGIIDTPVFLKDVPCVIKYRLIAS
jgi:hypothetical protein